ncbi:MAG: DNA-processing protein DprA [Alphaproteobacteria bacterium]|nr:DNA-processing protein DprA [Alphaproteobacteria bacterium]
MTITAPKNETEKLAWLRLIRSENIGPIAFYQLLRHYGSAENAIKAIPDLVQKAGSKRQIQLCSIKDATDEYARHQKNKIHLIARGESNYPPLLAEIDDAPPLLSVMGHPHLLLKKSVGIVGARNASLHGRRLAQLFAKSLGEAGYVISSGLARGIDTSAHEASLEMGTIAVVAGGVDFVYPPENLALYTKIVEMGAIISECPLGVNPQARHFPRRNRLISGISLGVVIVEAALKSGSLITADFALDQNREVFAIPGSPLDPRAHGTNALIKQGAHLVQNGEDVIEVLKQSTHHKVQESTNDYWKNVDATSNGSPTDNEVNQAIEELKTLLSFTPNDIDEIMRSLDLPPKAILTALLALELAGRVVRHTGNKVSLTDDVLFNTA